MFGCWHLRPWGFYKADQGWLPLTVRKRVMSSAALLVYKAAVFVGSDLCLEILDRIVEFTLQF